MKNLTNAAQSRWSRGLLLVVLLVAMDQLSKFIVETSLPFHTRVDVLPFLALFRTYNEGIAFSFLSSMNDTALVAFTLVIIAMVIWLWHTTPASRRLTSFGYVLIIGGAIGNLIDRTILGHVVDFIQVHTQNWSFAVFNIADSFITIGAVAIILDEVLQFVSARKNANNP